MPSLFLSHSSADKTFVEKLAKDLEGVGVNVWFDKWEIKVGDSLTGKIEEGLQANDYLGLVLSPAAVASEWVKAELSAAWCRQMSSRKIVVLPILYQDCEIPFLLEDRKYADFRTSYDEGFMALCAALGLKHSEALSENNWRLFMGDREADWKYYREQEYKRLVTRLVDRARQYNWSSWTGGTKNPLSIWRCRRSDRSPPSSASKPPSTGRLTHSKPDSTISNSLLLRCLASCFSCACSRFRSCSRKSATSFGTDTCSPL